MPRPARNDVERGVRHVPLLSQFIPSLEGRTRIARSTRVERVPRVRILRGFRAMEFEPGIREEAARASSTTPERVARGREEQKELRERAAAGRERGSRGVPAQQRQQRLVGQRGVEQESSERR